MKKLFFKTHVEITNRNGVRVKTWGLIPVAPTNILSGIYNPESKELELIFTSQIERIEPVQVKNTKGRSETQMRKVVRPFDAYITEEDIPEFLELYVENNFEFVEIPPMPQQIADSPAVVTNENTEQLQVAPAPVEEPTEIPL